MVHLGDLIRVRGFGVMYPWHRTWYPQDLGPKLGTDFGSNELAPVELVPPYPVHAESYARQQIPRQQMQRAIGTPEMGSQVSWGRVLEVRRPTLKRLSLAQGWWLPFLDDDKREVRVGACARAASKLDTAGGRKCQSAKYGLRHDSRERDAARFRSSRVVRGLTGHLAQACVQQICRRRSSSWMRKKPAGMPESQQR